MIWQTMPWKSLEVLMNTVYYQIIIHRFNFEAAVAADHHHNEKSPEFPSGAF
jgi:hypothetical protein